MEPIATKDLYRMSGAELKQLAKEAGVKIAPSAGKDTIIEAIELEHAKREQQLKAKVSATLEAEAAQKLGLTALGQTRPLPEDVAILASKRFYVKFTNLEQPAKDGEAGADVEFTKGTHAFYLYDGRIHVLPAVLIAEDIEQVPNVRERLTEFFATAGLPVQANARQPGAQEIADGVLRRMMLPGSATYPVFGDVTLPTGERISRQTGKQPRWLFHVIGEAPAGSPFGVVTDEKELKHAKHSQLVPLG